MRKGLIVTLAVAGLVVAVGLTLAASSLADQSLPREGHVVPIVHVETGPSPMLLPSAAPGSALAPNPKEGGGVQKSGGQSPNKGNGSPVPSPGAGGAGSSRFSDDHGNPGSDD